MKNRVTKVQHQNTKNQTVILIFLKYRTYLLIRCVFYLENDDTLINALTICKYHEKPMVQKITNVSKKYYKKESWTCVLITQTYNRL